MSEHKKMTAAAPNTVDPVELDEYDLTTEHLVAPETNSFWWPQPVPTDGPAPAP